LKEREALLEKEIEEERKVGNKRTKRKRQRSRTGIKIYT
jgi:hypothetical protein